jgi:DNA polymerase III epsilon subunit-like protein
MPFDIREFATAPDFLVLDVEGDGAHGRQRPVEISVVEFADGAARAAHHWIVDPGGPIDPFVTGVHGLSDRDVAGMPGFDGIEEEVAALIAGRMLAAHDVASDLLMLGSVLPGAAHMPSVLVDTQRFARRVRPGLPGYSLDRVCGLAGVGLPEKAPEGLAVTTNAPWRAWRRHAALADGWLAGTTFSVLLGELATRLQTAGRAERRDFERAGVVTPRKERGQAGEKASGGPKP